MPKVFLPVTWKTSPDQLPALFPESGLRELKSVISLRGWGKEKFHQGRSNTFCEGCEFTIGSIEKKVTSVELRKEGPSVEDVERSFQSFQEALISELGPPSKALGKRGGHNFYREWKRTGYHLRLILESRSNFYSMQLSIQRTPRL